MLWREKKHAAGKSDGVAGFNKRGDNDRTSLPELFFAGLAREVNGIVALTYRAGKQAAWSSTAS